MLKIPKSGNRIVAALGPDTVLYCNFLDLFCCKQAREVRGLSDAGDQPELDWHEIKDAEAGEAAQKDGSIRPRQDAGRGDAKRRALTGHKAMQSSNGTCDCDEFIVRGMRVPPPPGHDG